MIPWDKLPRQLQKYILISVIVSTGATTTAACQPIVCDPVPPPTTARPPSPDFTPIICDPMPPPSAVRTPSPVFTPIICDPMPPPTSARSATPTPMVCDPPPPPSVVRPARRFEPQELVTTPNRAGSGAIIQGRVLDAQGNPVPGVQITAVLAQGRFYAGTDEQGNYTLELAVVGDTTLYAGDDQADAIHIQVKEFDSDTLDWVLVKQTSSVGLPLAEIRTVEIVASDGQAFRGVTPWPGARLSWMVSGGQLSTEGDLARWQAPSAPGRYLLQVVADWGPSGLAVDATTLTVKDDGSITVG